MIYLRRPFMKLPARSGGEAPNYTKRLLCNRADRFINVSFLSYGKEENPEATNKRQMAVESPTEHYDERIKMIDEQKCR